MKKTRFLSLLLALALLLLPAASMADTSGAASPSAGAVAVVSPSAQPNTTSADLFELLADALHIIPTDPAVIITEIKSQINTAEVNEPDVPDRLGDRSEFDSLNAYATFGEGGNLWERFLKESGFGMIDSGRTSVNELEYFSYDFDMTESAPKSTFSPTETAALVQSVAKLREANLRYAAAEGLFEGLNVEENEDSPTPASDESETPQ